MTNEDSSNTTTKAQPVSTSLEASNAGDPVLHRLKDLQDANTQKDAIIEQLKNDLKHKDEQIKHRDERVKDLSADKRKDMEEFMKGVVDTWLSSLSGVSEENKSNFRNGIKTMAEAADTRNPAWEIVCNASIDHQTNVKKIEELLMANSAKDKQIEELRGFKNEASRIGTAAVPSSSNFLLNQNNNNKRQRLDGEGTNGAESIARHLDSHFGGGSNSGMSTSYSEPVGTGSAWDNFHSMLQQDSRSNYY